MNTLSISHSALLPVAICPPTRLNGVELKPTMSSLARRLYAASACHDHVGTYVGVSHDSRIDIASVSHDSPIDIASRYPTKSIQNGGCSPSLHACTRVVLQDVPYYFRDVIGVGNCAFEAVLASGMVPQMDVYVFRQMVIDYASTLDIDFVTSLCFQVGSDSPLATYLTRMRCDRVWAGTFEFMLISLMFNIDIEIISNDSTKFTTVTRRFLECNYPAIMSTVNPWPLRLTVLHHKARSPAVIYPMNDLNHYGVLFASGSDSPSADAHAAIEKLVSSNRRRYTLDSQLRINAGPQYAVSSEKHIHVCDAERKHIHQMSVTRAALDRRNAKRRLQRADNEFRQAEQEQRNVKRRLQRSDDEFRQSEQEPRNVKRRLQRADNEYRQSEQEQRNVKRRVQRTDIEFRQSEKKRNNDNRRLQRTDDEFRQSEQEQRNVKRRLQRVDDEYRLTELERKNELRRQKRQDVDHRIDESKRDRANRGSGREMGAHAPTSSVLDTITGATISDDEHDHCLQPLTKAEAYSNLDLYTEMMGETHHPTALCAVCAMKHVPGKIERIAVDDIPNFILLAAETNATHRTLDPTGVWCLLNEAVFELSTNTCVKRDNVLIDNISQCCIDICTLCLRQLSDCIVPLRSLRSFDTGPIPRELHGVHLTYAERALVSSNFGIFSVLRIKPHRYKETAARARVSQGHCVSFKHSPVNDIIRDYILPFNPSDLPRLMSIVFVAETQTVQEARQLVATCAHLTVRVEVIHLVARLKAQLNDKWTHDPTRFANHISGTVPECIMDMVDYESMVVNANTLAPSFVQMDNAMKDDYARRDHLTHDELLFGETNIDIMKTSGAVVSHLLGDGLSPLKQAATKTLSCNALIVPRAHNPMSDYDTNYFVNNYGNIFMHGIGARPANVSVHVYVSTIMQRPMTTAETDYSFCFEARNVVLRHRTLRQVRLCLEIPNSGASYANICDDDFNAALCSLKNGHPVGANVQALLDQIKVTGADLRGTPQALNRYRGQILSGLYPLFGPHNVWVTLNMQESSSQVVLRISGAQDEPIAYEYSDALLKIADRMRVTAQHPMAVAKFFHIFMSAFLSALLGMPFGSNKLKPTHKGIFGWTQSYFFNLEVSGKGTGPHAHGQVKIRGLDRSSILRRFHDPAFVTRYKTYLMATFSQDLPNALFDVELSSCAGVAEDLKRARRESEKEYRYADPLLIEPNNGDYMPMYPLRPLQDWSGTDETLDDYLAKRLIRILRECGIHEHSYTCRKNGHAGDDDDCRMGMPQPTVEELFIYLDERTDPKTNTTIVDGVEVVFPRDHPFVVAYNRWLTLATAANSAIHYMASGREGRTKAIYTTDYSVKKPLSTYECIALFRASMQAKRKRDLFAKGDNESQGTSAAFNDALLDHVTVVNRCMNAMSGAVQVTGYEACADLIGVPDHYACCEFVPFNAWAYMYAMIGQSHRTKFNIVDGENGPVAVTPVQDYLNLDIANEQKMSAYEFTAFYKRRSRTADKAGAAMLDKLNVQVSPDGEAELSQGDSDNTHGLDDETPRRGRPLNPRYAFTAAHRLSATHHTMRQTAMKVPWFVGHQYPHHPPADNDDAEQLSSEGLGKRETYAKFMLATFRPYSLTWNNRPDVITLMDEDGVSADTESTWWETWQRFLSTAEPWVCAVVSNMDLATDRDDSLTKGSNLTTKVSSNTMNHCENRFDVEVQAGDLDWKLHPDEAERLLRMLECEMAVSGMNLSRSENSAEVVFIRNGLRGLQDRFGEVTSVSSPKEQERWVNNRSLMSIKEGVSKDSMASLKAVWNQALRRLLQCNEENIAYTMNTDLGSSIVSDAHGGSSGLSDTHSSLRVFLSSSFFVDKHGKDSPEERYKASAYRPSWDMLPEPPTILETFEAWHLTKNQAELAIIVLDHFEKTRLGLTPPQLLALCLGPPGTGKTQVLLCILWHMAQWGRSDSVCTCTFTGGAAMLIATPYTNPMTTCRQFSITLKGPNQTNAAVEVLVLRIGDKEYVFLDEYSFVSYRHLYDIAQQIAVGIGHRAVPGLPFSGMNIIFFGDNEQLSKPGDKPMYYGAMAESSLDPADWQSWFASELMAHNKNTAYDPMPVIIGRGLWTSVNTVRTLVVQKRSDAVLLQRCQALREEELPDAWFDGINDKAIGSSCGPDLSSPKWADPLFIVMRHALRIPLDFSEAHVQASLNKKRLLVWRTEDRTMRRPLPAPLQLAVDSIVIGKVPRHQYYYEGMSVAFLDNKYFDAGNATNNVGYAFSITLHHDEPPDDFSMPFRRLQYMPVVVLLYVPNAKIEQLSSDLPKKVIPLFPQRTSKQIRLGDNRFRMQDGTNVSTITVSRLGFHWLGVHAVTQYFSQGVNLKGRSCIVDLRVPPGGGATDDFAASVLVMMSRHAKDEDWALLSPLWSTALERKVVINKMRELLRRDADLKAELVRLAAIETQQTLPQLERLLAAHPALRDYVDNAQ